MTKSASQFFHDKGQKEGSNLKKCRIKMGVYRLFAFLFINDRCHPHNSGSLASSNLIFINSDEFNKKLHLVQIDRLVAQVIIL